MQALSIYVCKAPNILQMSSKHVLATQKSRYVLLISNFIHWQLKLRLNEGIITFCKRGYWSQGSVIDETSKLLHVLEKHFTVNGKRVEESFFQNT